ncbi:MAG: glycine betaine/L-proline ABC transporter ATP-binding protein [candidate division KSB1 bacterium]|nr:glycine betaine/L-proline ABC transporter ATP-binding protein [candidate division KSB1 bacterium]
MSLLEVKNLYKIFGSNPERAFPLLEKNVSKEEILEKTGNTVAIDNANFSVEKKETFVIMGLSGSGKSTIIRCLNRLIEPTRGEILLDGVNIPDMSKQQLQELRRTKMSMVFQHFGLLPQRTVLRNVEYGLEISKVDKSERENKAMNAIELVGLKGYEHSMPDELSGGMQQRVGLARALANDPEILLMDEAFSALDPLIRTNMQDELLDLQAKMHRTIVFITHDLDEALKLGDRIAILGPGGKVVQIGTSEDILTNPADDYVKAFVQNVDRTKVITASSIMRKPYTIISPKDGPKVAIHNMEKHGTSTLFVTDSDRVLKGVIHIDDVVKLRKQGVKSVEPVIVNDVYITSPDSSIAELLPTAMVAHYPVAVVDDDKHLLGVVDRASVIAEVGSEEDNEIAPTSLSE